MIKNYEKEYSDKNFIEKTNYFFQTIYNTGKFYCNIAPNLFFEPDKEHARLIYPNKFNSYDKISWNKSSDGLIVVIHGLLGSPKTLGYEIAKKISLLKQNYSFEVILPIVPFKGNCALDVASRPIYELVLDYILTNKSKPIHLIACSNGCRIASWIECELRHIDVDIKLTCIAGAFGGSVLIDKFNLPLSLVLHNNILTDLSTGSNTNNHLKEKINSDLKIGLRNYEFYGTANDWYIPNFNGCFPITDQAIMNKSNFKVIYHELHYGYDHVSLGWYLSGEIVSNLINWIDELNKVNN